MTEVFWYVFHIFIVITYRGGHSTVVKGGWRFVCLVVQESASESKVVVMHGFLTEGNWLYLLVKFYRLYCTYFVYSICFQKQLSSWSNGRWHFHQQNRNKRCWLMKHDTIKNINFKWYVLIHCAQWTMQLYNYTGFIHSICVWKQLRQFKAFKCNMTLPQTIGKKRNIGVASEVW